MLCTIILGLYPSQPSPTNSGEEAEIKAASDLNHDYARGIEAKLGKDLESVQTQLRPIADDAGESRKTAAEAVGIAQTATDSLKGYQSQVEALHAGYLEAIKKIEESFATRLLGSQLAFEAKVGRLETELKGAEAEVAASADLRVKQTLAEVDKFKTELLGELHKNHEEIDKARLANEGFKSQLQDAMERMQTMEKGFLAETRMHVDKMEKTYQGMAKQFDDVKKEVNGYKQQLANVRLALEGAILELKKSGP